MKLRNSQRLRTGFTVVEMAISAAAFAVIMGAVVSGTIALQRGIASAEKFTVGQMHLPDLIAMDARRAYNVTPTLVGGSYTMPLTIQAPAVYKLDGKTMEDPVRAKNVVTVLVTGTGKAAKDPHNYSRVQWPLSYGLTGTTPTATVTYSLNGTTVNRTADGVTRAVATGVQSISFDPPNYDLTTPAGYVFTTRITFLKSNLSTAIAPTGNLLVSSIFMRGDYYDKDHD